MATTLCEAKERQRLYFRIKERKIKLYLLSICIYIKWSNRIKSKNDGNVNKSQQYCYTSNMEGEPPFDMTQSHIQSI